MIVRLENITKNFDQIIAVDDFTVTFDDGQLTGLLGPSGCGKSTLLFLLAGLHQATGGKMSFDDSTAQFKTTQGVVVPGQVLRARDLLSKMADLVAVNDWNFENSLNEYLHLGQW